MQPVQDTAIYEADKKVTKKNIKALDVIKRGYKKNSLLYSYIEIKRRPIFFLL